MKQKIKVKVSGPAGVGKTTLRVLLDLHLRQDLGIETDTDRGDAYESRLDQMRREGLFTVVHETRLSRDEAACVVEIEEDQTPRVDGAEEYIGALAMFVLDVANGVEKDPQTRAKLIVELLACANGEELVDAEWLKKRMSDEKIRESHQALYHSLDGRPASNHRWLSELQDALEAERKLVHEVLGAAHQRVMRTGRLQYPAGTVLVDAGPSQLEARIAGELAMQESLREPMPPVDDEWIKREQERREALRGMYGLDRDFSGDPPSGE